MSELQNAVEDLEVCRLCLNIAVLKISIFTDDFAKIIEILTSVKVKPNDGLPQVSCLKCARDVKMAFLVRRRIIQSHRAFTNEINQLSSRSNRQNSNESNDVASTSTGTTSLSSALANTERSIQQLQRIVNSSSKVEENITNNNTALSSEVESSNSSFETAQDDESRSVDLELLNSDTKVKTSNCNRINYTNLPSQKSEKIQNLKVAINTKYSNILKSSKQKVHSWKAQNKKDQLNVKWMEPMKMYCNICQIKFTNKITYKNHMSRHKHKTCPICDKQIRSAYLKKHMTLHEDSPAMCEVCGLTCKNPVSLKMHFFYYHKSNLSVCEDCGRSFKTKTKLLYHQRKDHTKERNYKCEICGKSFFAKMYLTKHINMKHMKMRPHICEYCGKGFSGKHALRTHIRQHTNEAPYQCNFCGERFRQRVSLRGHLKSRHKVEEEIKVFCDTCGKGFATNVALDVHARLHAEIKCPWCTDTFAEKMYLEQHISTTHPHVEHKEENNAEVDWMHL